MWQIVSCYQIELFMKSCSPTTSSTSRQLLEELTELPVMMDLASDFLDRSTPIFRLASSSQLPIGIVEER